MEHDTCFCSQSINVLIIATRNMVMVKKLKFFGISLTFFMLILVSPFWHLVSTHFEYFIEIVFTGSFICWIWYIFWPWLFQFWWVFHYFKWFFRIRESDFKRCRFFDSRLKVSVKIMREYFYMSEPKFYT